MLHPLLDALRTPSTPKNIVQRITYLGKLAELRIMDVKSDYTLRKTVIRNVFEQMPIALFGEREGGADPYLKGPPECTRGQPKCTRGQPECAIRSSTTCARVTRLLGQPECAIRSSTTCARVTRWPDQPECANRGLHDIRTRYEVAGSTGAREPRTQKSGALACAASIPFSKEPQTPRITFR